MDTGTVSMRIENLITGGLAAAVSLLARGRRLSGTVFLEKFSDEFDASRGNLLPNAC